MVNSRLTELAGTQNKIIQQLQGGVLQGQPGDALEASLGVFAAKITLLANKFGDVSKDITAAISDMQQADTAAAGDFN